MLFPIHCIKAGGTTVYFKIVRGQPVSLLCRRLPSLAFGVAGGRRVVCMRLSPVTSYPS